MRPGMKKKARFFATTVLTAAVVVGGLALFGALVGGAAKIADSSKASAATLKPAKSPRSRAARA